MYRIDLYQSGNPMHSLKKLALAVCVVAVSAAGASAADLAVKKAYTKAPPMTESVYDWSGFYIGGNAGYGWASNDHSDLIPGGGVFTFGPDGIYGGTQRIRPEGAIYGGQVGYNWQMANWVFGLEAAGDGSSIRRTDISIFYSTIGDTVQSRIEGTFTAAGRIGYAVNNWLPYVKGGYAGAQLRTINASPVFGDLLDHGEWRNGYVLGAGLEYGINRNWIIGVEYNYMDFGSASFSGATHGTDGGPENFSDKLKLSTVSARLSYKFSGPVVAKY
jgi:outer membrane immunogenic protein